MASFTPVHPMPFMSRARIFTAHIDPSLARPYEEAEFVEEGFNWKAFIFSGLWALYHRLWLPLALIVLFNVVTMNMVEAGALTQIGLSILQLAVQLFIGFEGNEWRRRKLARQGYVMADIVVSDHPIRAEQRFFERYLSPAQGAA